MENIKADIAVIAAGPAGLCAAAAAAENGASVVVFEKSNTVGGTANMGMGPFAVESEIQKRAMVNLTKEEAFEKYMDYSYWNVDAKIVRDYFWRSGETINWLQEMGVEFEGVMKNFPTSEQTWHVVKPENGGPIGARCASSMNTIIHRYCIDLGVKFFLNTPVCKIKKENDKVVGLFAKDNAGVEYNVDANAVIIATGGFGTNPEMVKELTGYTCGKNMFGFMIPGIVGDGIKMAWEIGAGKGRIMMEKIIGNTIPDAATGHVPGFLCFIQGLPIAINKSGKRICNEVAMQNHSVAGNIIDIQEDKTIYKILDSGMVKHFRRYGLDFPSEVFNIDPTENFDEEWKKTEKNYPECAMSGDSLEELAEKMKIDKETFIQTVEEYNENCNQNFDDDFGKPRKYLMPLKGKKYYAYKFSVGAYGSLGGIKINSKYEVVTQENNIISGLYAAGSDACEIYNGTYNYYFPGNTMGFAINSGRFAGENASEYVK